jgi:hypothetical protein
MDSTFPSSRAAFSACVAQSQAAEHAAGRRLAALSVGLGVGQLLFIKWAEHQLPRGRGLAIESFLFLAYVAVVGVAFARYQRSKRTTRLACPLCGRVFDDVGVRIVIAAGRCDGCGGEVLHA